MQDEHISGVKEPSNLPSQHEIAKQKANELLMKEKVTGSLQQISQTQQTLAGVLPKGVVNKQYNTPLGLYSNDAVQDEISKQANKFAELPEVAPQPSGPFPAINPIQSQIQRPQPVILTPNKEYNPQESATWKLLQEVEPKSEMKDEKIANFSSLKEHDPIYSEVYKNPTIKIPEPGQRPSPRDIQKAKSPVADLLPFNKKQNNAPSRLNDAVDSPVRAATLSESAPMNHQMTQEPVKIPVYEAQDHNDYYLQEVPTEPRIPGRKKKTNSIGGRKKIAQSMSFNKLMCDILGDQDDE
ncbi:unnamed protein product [Meganyctiphanes norvegica]|uniref:Zasp-like motif domain-containing protein n=1 Tax=Meganyctiphanes norvegica TaxID=48144 RepID=A0AAV2PIE0_MEGNR